MLPQRHFPLRTALLLCLVAAFHLAPTPALGAECDLDRPVVFAELDWASNRFNVAVARHILEAGYGCRTDSVPGSTLPLLTGMARGDVDVTMEIWRPNYRDAWERFRNRGQVQSVGVNFPDSVQGWFVPRYVVEGDPERNIEPMAPELVSVKDLPRYKELFSDPEEPGKGRFYNCILGWGCEIINTKKLEVYGLDDDYTNFRPGTGAALAAAIASAYKRGKPIVAYYWGPTWMMGKYDLLQLQEPEYTDACWQELENSEHPDTACAFPNVKVLVGVNTQFAEQAPTLVAFLEKYRTSSALISKMLAYMQDNDATAEQAAEYFLRNHEDLWSQWVPQDVARRVASSL